MVRASKRGKSPLVEAVMLVEPRSHQGFSEMKLHTIIRGVKRTHFSLKSKQQSRTLCDRCEPEMVWPRVAVGLPCGFASESTSTVGDRPPEPRSVDVLVRPRRRQG